MNRLTEVVKYLLIINVALFVIFYFFLKTYHGYLALHFPGTEHFRFYQLISHMFMHGSETHILFNMMSLYYLGPTIEKHFGSKRFLFYYLLCGLGAVMLHLGLGYFDLIPKRTVVGASGAIMGIFIAFGLIFPNAKLQMMMPPIPIKAKYLMFGLVAIDLFSGISGAKTGIAHFGHLGGAIAGIVLITAWGKNSLLKR